MFEKIKRWLSQDILERKGYIWDKPLRVYFDGAVNLEEKKLLTPDENGNLTIDSGTWQFGKGYIFIPSCGDNGDRLVFNGIGVE